MLPETPDPSNLSDNEFSNYVGELHSKGVSFSSHFLKRVSDDQYNLVLNDVARRQRGAPERAMLNAQSAMGGGVLSYAAEHGGDLTHRASETYATSGRGYSLDFVAPKVDNLVSVLSNPYGFGREHKENLVSNATHRGIDLDTYNAGVDSAMRDYANAHRNLPVYNQPMHQMRDVAIQLGHQNFDSAKMRILDVQASTRDQSAYNASMSRSGAIEWGEEQEARSL